MRTLLWTALTFSSFTAWAQAPFITYHADLMRVLGSDQVQVSAGVHWEALPGDIEDAPIVWQFPKTIPGTYATEDYGKYIKGLEAYKSDGTPYGYKAGGSTDGMRSSGLLMIAA